MLDVTQEFPKPLTDIVVRAAELRDHDGLRRRVPDLPGQALRGLGRQRSGRAAARDSPRDPRRHQSPRRRAARNAAPPRRLLSKPVTQAPLHRRVVAELLGSAFLAAVVIGSGIAASQLSPGDVGLELFENAAATAAGLFTIILMFGPVSGGHFNPVVSLVDASFGGLSWRDALAYIPAQIAGCILGAIAANAMFADGARQHLHQAPRVGAHLLLGGDRDRSGCCS